MSAPRGGAKRAEMPSCAEASHCAPADAMNWKLNVILTGVAMTFATVLGLVKWTIDRVEQVEARAVDAAEVRAAKVADDRISEARDEWRADLARMRP